MAAASAVAAAAPCLQAGARRRGLRCPDWTDWRVRGEQRLQLSMLADPGFLRVFGLAVAAHMIGDMSFELPLYLKCIALGFVAWVALLSMIQGGPRQIENEQLKHAAALSA